MSDTVLFTSENNDIANQSVDTSFFTSEKNRMTNQLREETIFKHVYALRMRYYRRKDSRSYRNHTVAKNPE